MTFSARTTSPQAAGSSRLLAWASAGALVGLVFLWSMALGQRWAVYFLAAVAGAGVMPVLARRAGSLRRFFLIVCVLSLSFELSWDVIKVPGTKAAGPPGITISLTLMAAVGLLGLRAIDQRWHRSRKLDLPPQLLRWSGIFLLSGALSGVNATDHSFVLYGLWEIVTLILIGIVACHEAASREGLATIKTMLFLGLGLQSVFILLEFFTGEQFSLVHGISGTYAWASGGEGRYAGTMGAPSAAADYIVVCLLFLGGEMFATRGAASRRQSLLFALGFLVLLMTETREAWIGMAIGATGLGRHFYRRGTIPKRLLLRLVMAGVTATLIAWPLVSARLAKDQSADAATRWNLVLVAMQMIREHPWAGIGLNTADHQVMKYAALAGMQGWVFIVHNQFLLIFAETGIAGFVSFVALFVTAIAASARCAKAGDPLIRDTGVVLFWVLVVLVWGLNLDSIGGVTYKLVFFLMGMTLGLERLRRGVEGTEGAAA